MWNPFKKKKSPLDLLVCYNWVNLTDNAFIKDKFRLELSIDGQIWNIKSIPSGSSMCGSISDLEDGLIYIDNHLRYLKF